MKILHLNLFYLSKWAFYIKVTNVLCSWHVHGLHYRGNRRFKIVILI